MDIQDSEIAIVHDWFQKKSFGGAEKVTLLINKHLSKKYSRPDIFSITSNTNELTNRHFDKDSKTSFIQKLPFGQSNVQSYLPILPFAIEQLDLRKYNLILSSSHAFAKGVLTGPDQLHISYVHTPMRYAWDQMQIYLKQSNLSRMGLELPIRYMLYKLREWDYASSQRIDYLISNSNFTARRIKKYWGLNSEVIHPPVEIDRFKFNNERDNYYLSINRLVPNKRIDLLIKSFNKLQKPLFIIGEGPERKKLQKIAKSNIKFLGKIPNKELDNYMSRCRAFVYAGVEDFGIAPVEAIASGAPVIAYGKGGILDSVNCLKKGNKEKVSTGILFNNQSSEDIIDTINWFEDTKSWKKFNPQDLNNYAQKFSSRNFKNKFDFFIRKSWDNFQKKL